MLGGVAVVEKFLIKHTEKLEGKVSIQGAKNSALPILTATLLCDGICTIKGCPNLSDVDATLDILKELGAKVLKEDSNIIIDSSGINNYKISKDMMKKMRSSILFLGATSARLGRSELSFPGGCKLGPRPIDWHLEALSKMGLKIKNHENMLYCKLDERFKGEEINLPLPSVGATENVILAAVLARGVTVINNAAREPEICDMCNFLVKCGAKIEGIGQSKIKIVGVKKLCGAYHEIIPDRIVAATFLLATATIGGDVTIENVIPEHLQSIFSLLQKSGYKITVKEKSVRILSAKRLKAFERIITEPYPGFPTDAQALFMALSTVSSGTSIFIENIFKDRYKHANELLKLGADIKLLDRTAIVKGVKNLQGADLQAKDLRGAAALSIAAMAAQGESTITGLEHLDRGYEDFELSFKNLGTRIKRI